MRKKLTLIFVVLATLIIVTVVFLRQQGSLTEQATITLPSETPDFASMQDANQKKQAFFDFLAPSIQLENRRIISERKRLNEIKQALRSESINADDTQYARQLGERYFSTLPTEGITPDWLNKILIKVNVLPNALVLTQAANESAWGTSRFATEANNYFGQWCYKAGCGLIPLRRQDGATHEVAKFKSVTGSVHGYFMNVNRNRAYSELREIRNKLAKNESDLLSSETATALTNGLLRYSERGQDYVDDLQTMIRINAKYWTKQ
ncbi:glucosaminidase domain-containing protein [Vibrio sp. F74]|uniref:glucosaminidase domain-containing protein n=1 Tax=Vibrio sp. F74 TaxID=700020 RepID=UPI0035F54F4B